MNEKQLADTDNIQILRDPRTGKLKEVDLSTIALSRTMADIRKAADLINEVKTDVSVINHQLLEIESMVLDHAQFSEKLQNLQIKLLDKTIEVVRNFKELQEFRINFIRNIHITAANNELSKYNTSSMERRRNSVDVAIKHINKGMFYLPEDPVLMDYSEMLVNEYDNLDKRIKKKQESILHENKRYHR